jgi:hypothetical protein
MLCFHRFLVAAVFVAAVAAPSRADELQYLPNGTFLLYSLDVKAALKSKLYEEVRSRFKELEKELGRSNEEIGIDVKNMARITAGAASIGWRDQDSIIAVATIKPVTAAEIKTARKPWAFQKDFKFTESKVGKHTVYEESYSFNFGDKTDDKPRPPEKGQAFCVVEDKVVLYGRLGSLKKVLERSEKVKLSPGAEAGLKAAGLSEPLTMIIDLQAIPERDSAEMKKALGQVIPGFADAFANARTLTVRASAADQVKAVATVYFKDAASAADAKKVADGGLLAIKGLLADDPQDEPMVQKAKKGAREALGALKLAGKDTQVSAEIALEPAVAAEVARSLTGKKERKKEFKEEKKQ